MKPNAEVQLMDLETALKEMKSRGITPNEGRCAQAKAGVIRITLKGDEFTQEVYRVFAGRNFIGSRDPVADDLIASGGKNGHPSVAYFVASEKLAKMIAGHQLGGKADMDGIVTDIAKRHPRGR